MAGVTVEIKGNTSFFDRILQRVGVNTPEVTLDIAKEIAADVKDHWSGHFPPASMPGQPPAIRSGELDMSTTAVLEQSLSSGKTRAVAQASAKHARPLEYGTKKMRARPFMRPAIKRAAKTFKRRWSAIFDK